jgi:hypothetical protein
VLPVNPWRHFLGGKNEADARQFHGFRYRLWRGAVGLGPFPTLIAHAAYLHAFHARVRMFRA